MGRGVQIKVYATPSLSSALDGVGGQRQASAAFVCLFLVRQPPQWARASSFMRFLDHTQRRTTVGMTPLDEWSARRRDLYLTKHNTHNRRTSMRPVGFEPTISAGEQPQTASDSAATGIGLRQLLPSQNNPGTHCTGGWVDLGDGLHNCGEYRTHRDSNLEPSAHNTSPYRLSYPGRQIILTADQKQIIKLLKYKLKASKNSPNTVVSEPCLPRSCQHYGFLWCF